MNGAESLVRTLVVNGVDVCFTNPGTSEMHFVVEGGRATLDELARELQRGFAHRGPYLVELVL